MYIPKIQTIYLRDIKKRHFIHINLRAQGRCMRTLYSTTQDDNQGIYGLRLATERYKRFTATLTSSLSPVSPEEIGKLKGANELSPRNREMKLRKNEMKVPKTFFRSSVDNRRSPPRNLSISLIVSSMKSIWYHASSLSSKIRSTSF